MYDVGVMNPGSTSSLSIEKRFKEATNRISRMFALSIARRRKMMLVVTKVSQSFNVSVSILF